MFSNFLFGKGQGTLSAVGAPSVPTWPEAGGGRGVGGLVGGLVGSGTRTWPEAWRGAKRLV